MMRNLTRKAAIAAASAAVIGGGAALSAPAAFAGTPIDSGHGIAVTITNPAAATVTLGASTLAMDATVNNAETAEAPTNLGSYNDPGTGGSGRSGNGGITVQVTSNNGAGYVLDAEIPAGHEFTDGTDPAMPNNDFHVSSIATITPGGVSLNTADLSAPVQVLANSGPSGTVWDTTHNPLNTATGYVAGADENRVAAYVQPNVLVGGKSYTGLVEFFYIPN